VCACVCVGAIYLKFGNESINFKVNCCKFTYGITRNFSVTFLLLVSFTILT
jgi:hypothetical protein